MLRIKSVEAGNIGEELGLEAGDIIISLNQKPARDILDYYFHTTGEELELRVKTQRGQLLDLEIEKEYDEDLGLNLDIRARQCRNKCVFCFIDQQPPKLRRTLYIKDDDYRLSFLDGNYISLTNLHPRDVQRIIDDKISPLYVSVHATDPVVRARLLNSSGPEVMKLLGEFAQAGIAFHCQIVLCPGYNDGKVLEHTLSDLGSLGENLLSLAVVPVGLTRHREKLTPLEPVNREIAREVIQIIDSYQARFLKSLGRRVVFAADEFYVKAEMPIPEEDYYEDFAQLENGIGLLRKALSQLPALESLEITRTAPCSILIVTGNAAASTIESMARAVMQVFPDISIQVRPVENRFLGPMITVAGLLAGEDIQEEARDNPDWDLLLVPEAAVRAGCFIDDYTLADLASALDKPVYAAGDVFDLITIIRNEVI